MAGISDAGTIASAAVFAIVGLIFAVGSPEPAMAFHGWLLVFASAAGAAGVLANLNAPEANTTSYFDGPIPLRPSQQSSGELPGSS